MNLKQLQAFREVMLTGSVSKAAQNLLRTQPSISSQIASLETELGLKLFERRRGRLHPVPEAHYLFEEAREIIDRLRGTEQIMKSIRDLDRGTIRIVAMSGPSVFLLPRMIASFAADHEGVRFSLITRSSEQVQRLVSVQQYDIGLADLGLSNLEKSPLVDHQVMEFNCQCAMHRESPLAEKEVITPKDLDGVPMAVLFKDHPTTTQIDAAFSDAGAELHVRFESQYFIPMFTYVEAGLACSIVDPLSVDSYALYSGGHGNVVFRRFSPDIVLVTSLMTPAHRPSSNVVQAFSGLIEDELNAINRKYRKGASEKR